MRCVPALSHHTLVGTAVLAHHIGAAGQRGRFRHPLPGNGIGSLRLGTMHIGLQGLHGIGGHLYVEHERVARRVLEQCVARAVEDDAVVAQALGLTGEGELVCGGLALGGEGGIEPAHMHKSG